jgi:hypothetical protein
MEALLDEFKPLFAPPCGLPPARAHAHRIQLLPWTTPITVCPYRYAHAQKSELEKQCAEMLVTGIIRPISSAFSAPVLLVKKADDSW